MHPPIRLFHRSPGRCSAIYGHGLLLLMCLGCGQSTDRDTSPVVTERAAPAAAPEFRAEPKPAPRPQVSLHPIDQLEEGRLYRRATQALDEGNLAEVEAIRTRLADHPQYAVLAEAIDAMVLAKHGEHARSLAIAEQISTVPVMRAEAFMIAGEVFRSQGRWGDAIGAFQGAVDLHPQHLRAHRWLGALYHDTGAMQLATKHLRAAAELDPSDYRVLRLAGLIHYEYQSFDEAVRDYQRALDRSPPQPLEVEIRIELADSLRELRRVDEALATLEPCPESPDVLALAAVCHETSGHPELALQAAQRAVELEPRHPLGNLILGKLYLSERAWQQAIPYLQTAVEMDPSGHEPRFLLGRALLQTDRREEGQAQLARSTELKELFLKMAELHLKAVENPDDVPVRIQLGKMAEQLGRPSLALSWYQAARGLAPDHPEAKQAIEKLQAEALP